ncbi:MAG TPA: hypothetical protein VF603_07625 [Allosphingosinicella sp.]|jgi:hypothetical protein
MARKIESGISAADFESRRREIALGMLAQSERFMDLDNQINENFVRITGAIADFFAERPDALRSGLDAGSRLGDEAGEMAPGGFEGSGVIDTVLGTIGDVLKGEKEFIQRIVSRILGL